MPPEIFSFLQTQVNAQPQQLLPGIIPQENTGVTPGIFDALISEYTLQKNIDIPPEVPAQNHSAESSQPVPFTNSTIFSGRMAAVHSREISHADDAMPETKQNVTENNNSWQNLFADVKRSPAMTFKRHENFAPQSDFDDGITAADSLVDQPAQSMNDSGNVDTDSALNDTFFADHNEQTLHEGTSHAENMPESARPEIFANDNVSSGHDISAHEYTLNDSQEASMKYAPEDLREILPNDTQRSDSPENISHETETSQPLHPEHGDISEPSENPAPLHTVSRRNSADTESLTAPRMTADESALNVNAQETPGNVTENIAPEIPADSDNDIAPEIDADRIAETISPSQNQPRPRKELDTNATPKASANTEISSPNTTKAQETPAGHDIPANPEVFSEQEIPAEIETVNGTPASHDTEDSREIPESPSTPEKPAKRETTENSESQTEITDANIIMAGFSSVQQAADNPTISRAPEITDSHETSKPRAINGARNSDAPIIDTVKDINTKEASTTPQIPNAEEVTDAPKNSRTRTSRAHANTKAITDSDSSETSRPLKDLESESSTPTHSRMPQNQYGHEEITDSESNQPSESQGGNETSALGVRHQTARNSRAAQHADSRNEPRIDSHKAEALSDFQSFFDTVTRAKRTASRANTRPLSLRTDTYEASSVQSQGRTLRNGIVNVVRFIRADGVRKANIVVDPPALGRISVELTSSSSGVEASVKVANEQIRQIVQEQFTQLRDNLAQQGVQVSEFTVDVQQDSSRQGQDSGGREQRSDYTFTASEDDDDTENFRADLEEGLLYWIA